MQFWHFWQAQSYKGIGLKEVAKIDEKNGVRRNRLSYCKSSIEKLLTYFWHFWPHGTHTLIFWEGSDWQPIYIKKTFFFTLRKRSANSAKTAQACICICECQVS